jgi:hypothetical protein
LTLSGMEGFPRQSINHSIIHSFLVDDFRLKTKQLSKYFLLPMCM